MIDWYAKRFQALNALRMHMNLCRQSIVLLKSHGKSAFLVLPPPMGPEFDPRNRLGGIANQSGADIIEPSDYLCKENVCPVLNSYGTTVYTDGIHMRPGYSRSAAAYLEKTISGVKL